MKTIVRSYRSTRDYEREANRLAKKGFIPTATAQTRGHLGTPNKGLNVALLIMTGGLGLLFARTPDSLTVTYHCATCR